MNATMFGPRHGDEILQPIIEGVLVDVVNDQVRPNVAVSSFVHNSGALTPHVGFLNLDPRPWRCNPVVPPADANGSNGERIVRLDARGKFGALAAPSPHVDTVHGVVGRSGASTRAVVACVLPNLGWLADKFTTADRAHKMNWHEESLPRAGTGTTFGTKPEQPGQLDLWGAA